MITAILNNNLCADKEYDDIDNFNIRAEFQLSGDATAFDAIRMFNKALILEGYMQRSVYRAMVEFMLEDDVDIESLIKEVEEM